MFMIFMIFLMNVGAITPFIQDRVHLICPLEIIKGVGFLGIMSTKVRGVWVFQKSSLPIKTGQYPMYEKSLRGNTNRNSATNY
jgi:hypothetical protein